MKIFIDESGDLGFSARSSPYFVFGALIPHDEYAVSRCFKKIRGRLHKKKKDISEFKFNNSNSDIRLKVCSCLAGADVDFAYAVLRKEQVKGKLQKRHQYVYNYLSASFIASILLHYHETGPVNIILDKSLHGFQQVRFDAHLAGKVLERESLWFIDEDKISIDHIDSRQDPCIQAADFIAGAVHQHFREEDKTCYEVLKRKFVVENDYFEKPNRHPNKFRQTKRRHKKK